LVRALFADHRHLSLEAPDLRSLADPRGFLATTLLPHHANYCRRLRRRPRLHFLDIGLICYLLGIRGAGTVERHPLRGPVIEPFVVSELIKSFAARRLDAPLHFWRDDTGHEIDVTLQSGRHPGSRRSRELRLQGRPRPPVVPALVPAPGFVALVPTNLDLTGVEGDARPSNHGSRGRTLVRRTDDV